MTRPSARTGLASAAVAAGLALAAAPAAAADPAPLADRAGRACSAGDLEAAAASLQELRTAVEAELGPGSDAAQLVRLSLAHVERARGDEATARALEGVSGPSKGSADRSLQRALKKLRSCAAVAPQPAAPTPEVALGDRVNLARNQLNRGRYREARAVARDALATAGPDAGPQELMRLHETLALVNLQLGRRDEALRAATEADRHAARVSDVEVRITMARLTAQLGDLERAAERLDALESAARSPTHRAELEEARGDLWLRLGSPRSALGHLDRALEGHRSAFGANSPSTVAVIQLRGDALRLAGDFPAALAAYREARELRRKKLGSSHADVARTTNAIGVLQADLGDWQAADASFAEALERLRAALGAEHPEILTIRSNRALAAWGARGDAEAAAEYAAVVEALREALGPDHPSVAAAVRNLSRMEYDLGRAERAEALLDEALAAQTRGLGKAHPALAPTRLARARLLAHRGALPEAAVEVDRAIAVLVEARGPEHPVVVRARTLRARIAVAQGDDGTAFEQAGEASRALAAYTRRTFGALSDRQRALLDRDSQAVVGALLSVESAPAAQLFTALLPHRDAVLRSVAATHAGGGANAELAALRRRYVAAVLGSGSDAVKRVGELAARIDALEARAAANVSLPERAPEDVLRRACARLPADAALVKFASYDRTRPGRFGEEVAEQAAFVVRGGSCSVQRISLGPAEAVGGPAEDFAGAMREGRADAPQARRQLARLLLQPLAPLLAGADRWLVIPDGALWGVPLGVLPDPAAEGRRYLFERVTIGYLTSTFELAEAGEATPIEPGELRSLLVGAPDFGSGDTGPVVLTDAGPCQLSPFEALPATAREIEDVGSLVGSPSLLTGGEVTKAGIERALASRPWLLHFATHAYFAGRGGCGSADGAGGWREGEEPIAPNPLLLSGIALAGANAPARVGSEGQRGILTAYEVSGLDLRGAGLVVLSACDTGTGLQRRGQEVQGLRWGFRAAGARALVTSLWRSNDVATRRLMQAFYESLVSGDAVDDPFRGPEALRRAQLAQVEAERRLGMQRPLTWANFVFSGVL